ncbi:MAG: hypothetical protein ACRDWE_11450 [Acidimicrobiales bacterium]
MADPAQRPRSDHYLSEKVTLRLTPNEMEWVRSVARGMNPPVSESYVIRAALVGWRQVTSRPLIESLRPLPEPLDGERQPPTTLHNPRRRRAR